MSRYRVSVVKYEKPMESLRRAVDLAGGIAELPAGARVVIKPNIVMWTTDVIFPKWGILTTSRIIEDMVVLLKEHGIDNITIAEGMVTSKPNDVKTPKHAFENLGYGHLEKRYGVKAVNVMERPFEKVAIDDQISLKFNTDALYCDYLVNIPVLKTHSQTVVSLGIKNLKGLIDIPSRKKCHSPDPVKDLHYYVSRLADKMPPMFTLIDGIYTNEMGPTLGGRIHRTDLLVASRDVLSADKVGSELLGWQAQKVPHLGHACKNHGRPLDLSDVKVTGEDIDAVKKDHRYKFEYQKTEAGDWLPVPLAKAGIKGISYRKYDLTMCTYCSGLNALLISAVMMAWKGEPFEDVEILTGKTMSPAPGKNKTILVGKCMVKAHKDNPDIKEMIPVKGCPARVEDLEKALTTAGIKVDPAVFEHAHLFPGMFMERYKNRPEFDESFFQITP